MEKFLQFMAFAAPAVLGVAVAYVAGHRSVRGLRKKVGDNSLLTHVLSGDIFRLRHE